jgi:hypothetical protein
MMRSFALSESLSRSINIASASIGISRSDLIRAAVEAAVMTLAEADPKLAQMLDLADAMPMVAKPQILDEMHGQLTGDAAGFVRKVSQTAVVGTPYAGIAA